VGIFNRSILMQATVHFVSMSVAKREEVGKVITNSCEYKELLEGGISACERCFGDR
jgi:hypothetical protein